MVAAGVVPFQRLRHRWRSGTTPLLGSLWVAGGSPRLSPIGVLWRIRCWLTRGPHALRPGARGSEDVVSCQPWRALKLYRKGMAGILLVHGAWHGAWCWKDF